ncbi:MAG: hypothetical protein GY747_02585 [Planctomycetes bacterium]|nr:hypothetical protein [Planctomycetota bacterium]MCP4860639.1 hypothetical protein [Planctomycetota bacterium]
MFLSRRLLLQILTLTALLAGFASANAVSQERGAPPPVTQKVLMIGNSYSSQTRASFLTFAAGDRNATLTFAAATHGGWTTVDHYNQRNNAVYDNNSMSLVDKLQQEDWDIVLVQEQSTLPSEAYLDLGSTRTMLTSGWTNLSALIAAEAPNALIRPYETWPRNWGNSYLTTYFNNEPLEMHRATSRVYARIAAAIGGEVIPVGSAFTYSMYHNNTVALHGGDGSHPSAYGQFLAGAMLYAYVFDRSPYESSFSPGGDPASEAWLLSVADLVWQNL